MAVKKLSISLSSGLYIALLQWAAKEDNNPTSLATDLISALIREEIRRGKLTYEDKEGQPLERDSSDTTPYVAYIKAIAGIGSIDPLDLQKLADSLEVDSTVLAQKLKECCNANKK